MIKKTKAFFFHHSLKHPRLYAVARWVKYLFWRMKVIFNQGRNSECDPDKLILVSPGDVKFYIGGEVGDRFFTRGSVRDGDWDLKSGEFAGWDVYRAIREHFEQGVNWEDTQYYKRVLEQVRRGAVVRGIDSLTDVNENFVALDKLYHSIKVNGYLSRHQLAKKADLQGGWEPMSRFTVHDEVTVAINRSGRLMLQDGKHRLSIATVQGIPEIPVAVGVRHAKWEQFKQELLDYASDRSGLSYQPFTHPDLKEISVQHASPRDWMVRSHLPDRVESILDVGAYIGYFSLYFAKAGFRCTAIEHHPRHLYFMRKLRVAEGVEFEIVAESFLDWSADRSFDVLLALNIFHHFLKTKVLMRKMEVQLRRLTPGCVFLETHSQTDEIMRDAHANFAPREFAEYVSGVCALSRVESLGPTTRGREMFKISRE